MSEIELEITSLAAGGDGIGRDASGRVVFVPLAAPGDHLRVRLTEQKKNFARGEIVEIVTPGASRVTPVCPEVARGCGGCDWQQVSREAQLAAKQAIVAGALRKLSGVVVHPIESPCPPLGWRRRARFHVQRGVVGLYRRGSHELLPIAHCPQLEPALDAALARIGPRAPDGELHLVLGHDGRVASAPGEVVEIEPGLPVAPHEFAQASTAGNRVLIQVVSAALGDRRGVLVELYAGGGNFTRQLASEGWSIIASDVTRPRASREGVRFEVGDSAEVLARLAAGGDRPVEAVVLDPPRSGAAPAIDGIVRLAPRVIVYVSCDPATLARDAARLVDAGYRATDVWPVDLMPHTSHIEVVLRLQRDEA